MTSQSVFNPLEHPACLEFPLWLEESAWAEHIPFAMFLVSAAKPRNFVELGTFRGVSYTAFCQAVKMLDLDTRCFAVDTWQGDDQAGKLEAGVLEKLRAHHDPLYSGFSKLLRSTFDDAVSTFEDGSLDLLHIDGFHSYEAVRHDFETWLPKMSRRGIVLFHDTSEQKEGFGVWKFWEEISAVYQGFAFDHGHGLGVLSVGTEIPEGIRFVFEARGEEAVLIRKFFFELGRRIASELENRRQEDYIRLLKTHESVVMQSKFLRVYRILKFEGISSLWRKLRKQ